MKPLKVAMLGLKGLPGMHGGVEKHVEELGARLADRGHRIDVYCRKFYTPSFADLRGMHLVPAPTIHTKHLDATIHTLLGGIKAGLSDCDLVHYHAIGPSSMSFIARMLGKPVIATIHSQDYLRDKWSPAAKWMLRRAESATLFFAGRVIAVSRGLADRYAASKTPVAFIPNGVTPPVRRAPNMIRAQFGLTGKDYLFWAGRFSPEKGVHYLVDAFHSLDTDMKLVLAGGVNHTENYVANLTKVIDDDPRIITPGFVTGELLDELYSNAAAFVLPSEHEGMPVALLEAISYGLPCIASDIAPCREVQLSGCGQAMICFAPRNTDSLRDVLRDFTTDPGCMDEQAEQGRERVLVDYAWDAIAERVEAEYFKLLEKR